MISSKPSIAIVIFCFCYWIFLQPLIRLIMKFFLDDSPLGSVSKEKPWIGRAQLVKVDDASSTIRPLHWGVPQRFGPRPHDIHLHWVILFVSMACRFTFMLMTRSFIHISLSCNDTSDLVAATQRLEKCVADSNLWMTTNKLKLNNDKSEFLFLHFRFRHSLSPSHDFGWHGKHQALSTGSQSWRDF